MAVSPDDLFVQQARLQGQLQQLLEFLSQLGKPQKLQLETPPVLVALADQLQAAVKELVRLRATPPIEIPEPQPLNLEPLLLILDRLQKEIATLPEQMTKKLNITVGQGGRASTDTKLDEVKSSIETLRGRVERLTAETPISKVEVWADVATSGDAAIDKLVYVAVAAPGTALTAAQWSVQKWIWTRLRAKIYKRSSSRVKLNQKLLAFGNDADPWPNVKAFLDSEAFNL